MAIIFSWCLFIMSGQKNERLDKEKHPTKHSSYYLGVLRLYFGDSSLFTLEYWKMKKSRKILRKANIPDGLSEYERKTIENNVLLKHIIDNDLRHLWNWVRGIALALVGLITKVLLGG